MTSTTAPVSRSNLPLLRPTWVEVDLSAIQQNFRLLKRVAGPNVRIYAVLKGDAYGCGLIQVAKLLGVEEVHGLAVGNIEEAVSLRKARLRLPILVFGNILPNAAETIVRHKCIASVSDYDMALSLSRSSTRLSLPAPVFIKVDVGTNRLGIPVHLAPDLIRRIVSLPGIRLEGVHAHVPGSLAESEIAERFRLFVELTSILETHMTIPTKMFAGSSIMLKFPAMHLNAVDPGKALFGLVSDDLLARYQLRDAFSLKTKLIHMKAVSSQGDSEDAIIGVIPIGSADGFLPPFVRSGEALIRGERVAILGNPSAEHTRIDLTNVRNVKIGDTVILIGGSGQRRISVGEIASRARMTPSEVLRCFSRKLTYFFTRGRKIVSARYASHS